MIALSTEHGLPHWLAYGPIMRGWALAAQGQGEESIAQMSHGLAAYQATGAELNRPYFLVLLAEAYGKMGKQRKGLLYWLRRSPWWKKLASVGMRRRYIGCGAN